MMRKNIYLSVFVFLMALALAWWNLERSHNNKSLPERSAGHEEKDRVILEQPKDRVDDFAVNRVSGQEVEMSEPKDIEQIKSTQQGGAQVESLATIETSASNAGMLEGQTLPDVGSGSIAQSSEQPQAVRLADDFELPAAMMHMAAMEASQEGTGQLTAPVKAAVDHLVDEFYRDVSKAGELGSDETVGAEVSSQDQGDFKITDESGELTRVVVPTQEAMQATEKANQSHQLLFGDDAANRFGIQSKLEARLPVQGRE